MQTGTNRTPGHITQSTDPDNFLHLVTGGAALYFGTAGPADHCVVTP